MLVKDIMTKKVVTISSDASLGDAKKILKEKKFRRLPVVDNGNLVGIVTEARLEQVSPSAGTPLLWQIGYLIGHTTIKDVMQKNVVTISPDASVEQAARVAQAQRVGALVVIKSKKVIGILTTNDFFYNVLNPALGLGQAGSRIIVTGGGDSKAAEKILGIINMIGPAVTFFWTLASPKAKSSDLIIQLDAKDPSQVIAALQKEGFDAAVRPR